MDPDRYPVAWQDADGKTIVLGLGPLTAGVQKAFVNRVKQVSLADAAEWMPVDDFRAFRQELAAGGIFWTDKPCPAVATYMGTREGAIYLNRLLFGDDVKGWSDARLWELLLAKDRKQPTPADPNPAQSDYVIAYDLVWDAAHPKGRAPTGAAPTSSSGTTPSSPPTTSAAPTGTTGSSASSPAAASSASPPSAPLTSTG